MKIALLGYGRMGKIIARLASEHEIVYKSSEKIDPGKLKKADVAIDFSVAEAAFENITTCFEQQVPVVSGTTGWLEKYDAAIDKCEQLEGTFLYASNFSIGVNLFFQLNRDLAKMMDGLEDYQVSITEIHHTKKKDKPSGTAITLAEDLIKNSSKRHWELQGGKSENNKSSNTIPVRARRFEDVKGTHIVEYKSPIDAIEIKHTAFSREGFAKGALLAAEFIIDKKGIFHMEDVLKNLM